MCQHALALVHLVDVAARQLAVAVQRPHAEVHVAARGVGVAALDERTDQVEDRGDVLGGERLVVRAAKPEPLGVLDVVGGHLAREVGGVAPGRPRGVVDLVVDVGDVRDERDAVALVLEEPLELGEDDERPRVPDVHARVDGRPAGVDADVVRVARLERPHLARAGVVQPDRHFADPSGSGRGYARRPAGRRRRLARTQEPGMPGACSDSEDAARR
jgi:hypothetical protein